MQFISCQFVSKQRGGGVFFGKSPRLAGGTYTVRRENPVEAEISERMPWLTLATSLPTERRRRRTKNGMTKRVFSYTERRVCLPFARVGIGNICSLLFHALFSQTIPAAPSGDGELCHCTDPRRGRIKVQVHMAVKPVYTSPLWLIIP